MRRRAFNEVLASGEPDFPFALAWANESWRGFAHGITLELSAISNQGKMEKRFDFVVKRVKWYTELKPIFMAVREVS